MSSVQFNSNSFHPPNNTDTGRHTHTESLENGDVEKEQGLFAEPNNKGGETTDEYTNLVKYISTYREGGRRKSTASGVYDGQDGDDKKRPWWKFGGKKTAAGGDVFEVPDEWIETDIKQGITSAEVETRRKKTGWNELSTEKENMFLKFLGYFQGPILYGKVDTIAHRKSILTRRSDGNRRSSRGWSSRLDRLRCHYRYSVAQRGCRMVSGKTSCRCRRQSSW